MAHKTGRQRTPRSVPLLLQLGCGHLVLMLLAAGGLLLLNTLAVSLTYQAWHELRGGGRSDPRIAQTVLIVTPLVLLFLQYWMYDLARNWLTRAKQE